MRQVGFIRRDNTGPPRLLCSGHPGSEINAGVSDNGQERKQVLALPELPAPEGCFFSYITQPKTGGKKTNIGVCGKINACSVE